MCDRWCGLSRRDFGDGLTVNAGELNNKATKETKVQNGIHLRDLRVSARKSQPTQAESEAAWSESDPTRRGRDGRCAGTIRLLEMGKWIEAINSHLIRKFHAQTSCWKEELVLTEAREGCASEAGLNVGESPTCRVGLFATEHELNSVAARRGWMLREWNRRAVMKVNHIQ